MKKQDTGATSFKYSGVQGIFDEVIGPYRLFPESCPFNAT